MNRYDVCYDWRITGQPGELLELFLIQTTQYDQPCTVGRSCLRIFDGNSVVLLYTSGHVLCLDCKKLNKFIFSCLVANLFACTVQCNRSASLNYFTSKIYKRPFTGSYDSLPIYLINSVLFDIFLFIKLVLFYMLNLFDKRTVA